jgi:hypothetical protein
MIIGLVGLTKQTKTELEEVGCNVNAVSFAAFKSFLLVADHAEISLYDVLP